MTISTLKDLSKLIDLCRKKGVETIAVDGVELKLGDAPTSLKRNAASDTAPDKIIIEDQPTEDELRFWSVSPHG